MRFRKELQRNSSFDGYYEEADEEIKMIGLDD
jgi:hypothetical protein